MLYVGGGSVGVVGSSDRENAAPSRTVELTDQQVDIIEQLVGSGHYQDAGAVLRAGLELVRARNTEDAARLHTLREAASVGIEDESAGRYTEFQDGAALRSYLAERASGVIRSAAP